MNMHEQPDFFDDSPQQEKAHRIAALIAGYIHRSLTPSEHDELDAWVGQSDENMALFEELTDERATQQALDWLTDADGPRMLKKIKGRLTFTYQRTPMFSRLRHYGIAASVIVLLGIAGFIIYKKTTSSTTTAPQPELASKPADLAPGRDQAILTLNDGRTIVLDNAKDGTLATQGNSDVTKENGQLKYNVNGQTSNVGINYNTVTTPRGGSYPLTLSDGTRLWLNAASSITFPAVFTGNERRVAITGEVYFEVAHVTMQSAASPKGDKSSGRRIPFIVEIKDKGTQIEVLGTHFNINAYTDEAIIKTTLLEGVVKVSTGSPDNSHPAPRTPVLLKPGQQAQVDESGDIKTISDVDTDGITAWKNNMFRFKNVDIRTIMRQVSRWYDVDVDFEGKVSTMPYNCILSRDIPASTLFEVLEETGDVHFKIEGKKIKVLP